ALPIALLSISILRVVVVTLLSRLCPGGLRGGMCVLDWTAASSRLDRRVGPVFPVKIGQVGITSVGKMWSSPCIVVVVIILYFELSFKLPLCFEIYRLYLKLLCKTCVVN